MRTILDRRLLIITGKGGTGKSAVAAALALLAARQNKRVLVLQVNAKDRLSTFLDVDPLTAEIREVRPQIFAANMTPSSAMEEYVVMVVRFRAIYSAVFENRLVSRFLEAFPGLSELVMLGKAWFHAQDVEGKKGAYDLVILDAPSTGHGLSFFRLPQVILRGISSGLMAREAKEMYAFLADPQRTAVHIVTMLEEMPVQEAIELRDALREMGLPLGILFINAVLPEGLGPGEREELGVLSGLPEAHGEPLEPLLRCGRLHETWRRRQESHRGRLESPMDLPLVNIPYLFTRSFGHEAVEFMSRHIEEALSHE